MAVKQFPTDLYTKGFAIQPSDTVNIAGDSNNTEDVAFVYLHNTAADASCRVLLAGMADDATPVTVWLLRGEVTKFAVKRVFNTTPTPPAGLIGLY